MEKTPVVLLIEDNQDNRFIYATMLRVRGYQVLEAATGEEGLVMASEHRPDLILLDIGLPRLNGLQVLAELKRDGRTMRIPVFAITAHTFPTELEKIIAAGFEKVMTKPIEPSELVEIVNTWFGFSGEISSGGQQGA